MRFVEKNMRVNTARGMRLLNTGMNIKNTENAASVGIVATILRRTARLARRGRSAGLLPLAAILIPVAQAAEIVRGDAARGEQKAITCSACHGMDGNSLVPTFPKLAGLGEKYLLKQMQYIRDGVRPVAVMAGQVDNMSDQDLADIAAYFNQFERARQSVNPDLVALGEKVYRAGIKERNVAACIACHGANGNGNGPAGFPAIGGQYADYIATQLKAYRKGYEDPTGRVTGGETKIMRSNAFGLSDLEIEALAAYVSGLGYDAGEASGDTTGN